MDNGREDQTKAENMAKLLIDREMDFNTISEFTGLSMMELLEFYKKNYHQQYLEEIYEIMRKENINVFSEACEYLEKLTKLADEKRNKAK